jgi:hypothetical protein
MSLVGSSTPKELHIMTATATSKTIVLTFTPELPCNLGTCEALTSIGQLSITSDNIQLMPQCPTHGFAWECSEQEQLASVARYVNWLFDNEGTARVLRTAQVAEIPGYQPYEDQESPAQSWLVEWSSADRVKRLYVAWEPDLLCFEVYQ